MVNDHFLISIITVNRNNKNGLKKTIESVISQNYKPIEYIIIDGASTDDSQHEIAIHKRHISKWLSEKDNGIYDAMNKGIRLSTGQYVMFLNSGDIFFDTHSLSTFANKNANADIVFGDLYFVEGEKQWLGTYPDKLSFSFFLQNTLPHPASFIKRSVFEKIGFYETGMVISSDWAFFINAICRYNVSYKHIPAVLATYDHTGISSKSENQWIIINEKNNFLEHNFPLFLSDYKEHQAIKQTLSNFKNSRLRKYLSYIFKQLHIQ